MSVLAHCLETTPLIPIETLCTLVTLCRDSPQPGTVRLVHRLLTTFRASVKTSIDPSCVSPDELTDLDFEALLQSCPCEGLSSEQIDTLNSAIETEHELKTLRQQQRNAEKSQMAVCGGILPHDGPTSATLEALLVPLLPQPEENALKLEVLTALTNLVHSHLNAEAQLELFGSAANQLGFKSSDMDVCLHGAQPSRNYSFAHVETVEQTQQSAAEYYKAASPEGKLVCELADVFCESGLFSDIVAVATARVPLLKAIHVATRIHVDVAVGNLLGLENTRLLATYCRLDPRVRQLALLVKLWAKRRRIADASKGFLSSYAWVILCIHFLQHAPASCGGPLVPVLQHQDCGKTVDKRVDGCLIRYCDDIDVARKRLEKIRKSSALSPSSLALLLRGFFFYFASIFDFERDAVTIDRKKCKKSPAMPTWRLAIIDPFEHRHDLGSKLSGRRASLRVLHELKRACILLGADNVSEAFASVETNPLEGRLCHQCGVEGHQASSCPLAALRGPAKCFVCGKEGHLRKDCPDKGEHLCFRCNRPGHVAKECPYRSGGLVSGKAKRQEKHDEGQPMPRNARGLRPVPRGAPALQPLLSGAPAFRDQPLTPRGRFSVPRGPPLSSDPRPTAAAPRGRPLPRGQPAPRNQPPPPRGQSARRNQPTRPEMTPPPPSSVSLASSSSKP